MLPMQVPAISARSRLAVAHQLLKAVGFTVPYSVAVDVAGNMYVADNSANNVKKIPFNGGARRLL